MRGMRRGMAVFALGKKGTGKCLFDGNSGNGCGKRPVSGKQSCEYRVAGAFEKEADVQAEYALETLDISPLDYARYEISGAVRRNGVNHVEED